LPHLQTNPDTAYVLQYAEPVYPLPNYCGADSSKINTLVRVFVAFEPHVEDAVLCAADARLGQGLLVGDSPARILSNMAATAGVVSH
jgi:hypothetical protein